MRTELTNTPLGHVVEATPTRITFEVEGDAADEFEAGDEVMLMKRVEAESTEGPKPRDYASDWWPVPDGWLTIRKYAGLVGLTVRVARYRVDAKLVESCRFLPPGNTRPRVLVKDPR